MNLVIDEDTQKKIDALEKIVEDWKTCLPKMDELDNIFDFSAPAKDPEKEPDVSK